MVESTGRGCPVDTSVRSTEAPTEAAAENGCPVDTSVRSTEAPTEAAAETRVSCGHLCAQRRSTDRGGSRELEPAISNEYRFATDPI